MHFLYVDESGDPGGFDPTQAQTSSGHFILSGVVVPAADWRNYLSAIVDIRKLLKTQFGLPARAELHGAELINPRGNKLYQTLPGGRNARINLYRTTLQSVVSRMANVRFIHIYCDKSTYKRDDIEEQAWKRMIERFHLHLKKDRNGDIGMVFADATNEVRLRKQLRRMRTFHYAPSRYGSGGVPATADLIVEDPVIRDSRGSPVRLPRSPTPEAGHEQRPLASGDRALLKHKKELPPLQAGDFCKAGHPSLGRSRSCFDKDIHWSSLEQVA